MPLLATLLVALQSATPIASVSLYNPTAWDGPPVVEVPTGRLGAPGLIDWGNVHLEVDGQRVPFALREGRAHWQAQLTAPVASPRAEDLLVFSCTVPPNSWRHVELVAGADEPHGALRRDNGRIVVSYPAVEAAFEEGTGALLEVKALGESLLAEPFLPTIARLGDKAYTLSGGYAVGYEMPSIAMNKGDKVAAQARLVSSASSAALTELNYVLTPAEGPAIVLTYRVHASGLVEIQVNERPWQGTSPWLHFAVDARLAFKGEAEALDLLASRAAFYGFKDYAAATKEVAQLHRVSGVRVLELGDEAVNGRRYTRRLFPAKIAEAVAERALIEIADEGLVADVQPLRGAGLTGPVFLEMPDSIPPAARPLIEGALKKAGVEVAAAKDASKTTLRWTLAEQDDALTSDGFAVAPAAADTIVIRARTGLGLYNATQAIARHLERFGKDGGVPFVARNPVVELRAGGFGGGNFEVDFPYGPDEEWQQAFDGLLDSGMNVFGCLGMWGNWKMPVAYKYMPELHSTEPGAYDESSGAAFADLDAQRAHGLKLMRYLHDRGAQVWLWIPIGCCPTTFAKQFPGAMAPGSDKIPCSTHPDYQRYVDAFFKELLETYPIDGLFLIRDDNGGKCTCDRCKEHVAASKTKDPVWEQYLSIHTWLRSHGFKGGIAVYPYNDAYRPELDPCLPEDLYVVGHGAGASVLARDYRHAAPMGDTWLDNLYANFRIPPTPRMRRLLCDRESFWIGGAYRGTELPWEAIGYFGWEPTATANSLRYAWGLRAFGTDGALPFARMDDTYEHLWDLNAQPMSPPVWLKLGPEQRRAVVEEGMRDAAMLRTRLGELKAVDKEGLQAQWFRHAELFAPFFEYHLNRLDKFAVIYDRVLAHRESLARGEALPLDIRSAILADYASIYDVAAKYDAAMQAAVGDAKDGMLWNCRWMTSPYKEWMAGYDQWLEWRLDVKQFAGTLRVEVPAALAAGQPFTLRVELVNQGVCPWLPGIGHRLEFSGSAEKLGLPKQWDYEGQPLAPGDRRTVEIQGTAPKDAGEGTVDVAFVAPFREPARFLKGQVKVAWK